MLDTLLPVLIPASLTAAAVAFGHLVNRRRNREDVQAQIIDDLQTERNLANSRADRAERRVRVLEDYIGRLRKLMFGADMDVPEWPSTDEIPRPRVGA